MCDRIYFFLGGRPVCCVNILPGAALTRPCVTGEVLAEADSIIACVNRVGEVQRIPEDLVEMTTSKDHT